MSETKEFPICLFEAAEDNALLDDIFGERFSTKSVPITDNETDPDVLPDNSVPVLVEHDEDDDDDEDTAGDIVTETVTDKKCSCGKKCMASVRAQCPRMYHMFADAWPSTPHDLQNIVIKSMLCSSLRSPMTGKETERLK